MVCPGRKEIREEVFSRLKEHGNLYQGLTADKFMDVIMSNIGWYWDVDDVGRSTIHVGTHYEQESAVAGLRDFIQQCMDEFEERKMNRSFGAMTPPGLEWMEGKTVAEIDAINAESLATGKTSAEVATGDEWKARLNQGDKQ